MCSSITALLSASVMVPCDPSMIHFDSVLTFKLVGCLFHEIMAGDWAEKIYDFWLLKTSWFSSKVEPSPHIRWNFGILVKAGIVVFTIKITPFHSQIQATIWCETHPLQETFWCDGLNTTTRNHQVSPLRIMEPFNWSCLGWQKIVEKQPAGNWTVKKYETIITCTYQNLLR